MLYIFGGLPGTGKSTLAAALARHTQAVYVRIDTIEQAMRDAGVWVDGPAGYSVAYRVAADNLRLGRSVIADSVNPLAITRQAWRDVALQNDAPFVEIEVVCSDREEHRGRVETRQSDVAGLQVPSWQAVVERAYDPWDEVHIVVDTAGVTVEESFAGLVEALNECKIDHSS